MSVDETPAPEIKPAAVGSYEFSAAENRVFDDLAKKARSVGFFFIIYGSLVLLGFLATVLGFARIGPFGRLQGNVNIDLGTLISGLVFLLMGIWSRRSAAGFDAIAKTRGSDISHLMGAVKNLSKLYGLLDRIIFIVLVVLILAMIAALIATLSR